MGGGGRAAKKCGASVTCVGGPKRSIVAICADLGEVQSLI